MLVGFWQRGIRPDLIMFSDVGAERENTYGYLEIINEWLEYVGFPPVTVVRYVPQKFKHWPPYYTIEENCLTNGTLPSLAYGGHACSSKWKIQAQAKYLKTWAPAVQAWAAGVKVTKCIGFEASPHELRRTKRCSTFAVQDEDQTKTTLTFPLQDWGWDRDECKRQIEKAGLVVPPKSSCYFCPAMKPWEVEELSTRQLASIVIIEARAAPRHLAHAAAKGWPYGVGKPCVEGLWRKAVKGMRGATPKPGSMTEYIRSKGLLPAEEIDRLIELTPTEPLSKADFDRLGFNGWQDWITSLVEQAALEPMTK
jgi:hypothetical protein